MRGPRWERGRGPGEGAKVGGVQFMGQGGKGRIWDRWRGARVRSEGRGAWEDAWLGSDGTGKACERDNVSGDVQVLTLRVVCAAGLRVCGVRYAG